VGQVIEAGPYTITEAEILQFASAYDPQWFHTDPEAARQGPFGGLIASGWHTCGIAMRLVAEHVLRDSESFASPGVSDVRWPHPVRPGDVLSLRLTVNEVRRSAKRPELGIVQWSWHMRTQEDRTVLELEGTSMFNLKSTA
jgi:acyl dehydratase